jgi:signal transduction histidine kinase/ActR/RegA family two-component response regulator
MMTPRHLALVVAGLLLALTYLLMPLARPNTDRHNRSFDALWALQLNDAALQRDVLKVRAGLLHNYDPLVKSVGELRRAIDVLRSDAGGNAKIDRRLQSVAAAVDEQEALVETFKSNIALLQNSLSFFRHTMRQFDTDRTGPQSALSKELGTLAQAMLHFTSDPRPDNANDVVASLGRLSERTDPHVRALLSHGHLIVATLPEVDSSVSRLLTAPMPELMDALQGAFMEAHAEATGRASIFGILLYAAALGLVAYVIYLFLRLRANEARLQQAQRLEAIGTLAGGIAHEFNNILGAIFGYAELALSALSSGGRAERHVRGILTSAERAQAVINRILTFSRRSERQPRLVVAGPVIAEAAELMRASLPATVAIETTLHAGDATVMADPTELQQVVMNLCTNGAHAMKNHGTLRLTLDTIEAARRLALSHGNLPSGRYVRLAVQDTGSGIDPATLGRIFEPFFTTKGVGQGTGLGLSTVHGIIMQHGGALNVKSRPGEGSLFQAYLPRAAEFATGSRESGARDAPRGRGETILIVDDDAPLVPLVEEMLAGLGYEAVGFGQSAAALDAFRTAPDRFDLVLTDDIMPEITGTELAGMLHEIRPSLPIVLMTGGGRSLDAHRLSKTGIRDVIRKPLLSTTVAELLARHLPERNLTKAG